MSVSVSTWETPAETRCTYTPERTRTAVCCVTQQQQTTLKKENSVQEEKKVNFLKFAVSGEDFHCDRDLHVYVHQCQ